MPPIPYNRYKNERRRNSIEKKGKLLALDVGDKRIGVAVSDPFWIVITPYTTLENNSSVFNKIKKIVEENGIEKIIVGLPLTLSGKEGEQAKKTRAFVEKLKKYVSVPVEFVDERFTTDMAEEFLRTKRKKYQKDKKKRDSIAAAFILESYIQQKI